MVSGVRDKRARRQVRRLNWPLPNLVSDQPSWSAAAALRLRLNNSPISGARRVDGSDPGVNER